jgi:enolase
VLGLDTVSAVASVPSGKSTGSHEALELRDNDPHRYFGRGVHKAVANVNDELRNALLGKTFEQAELDSFLRGLDGTPNKSRLGANALLGISMAFARACAEEKGAPLYAHLGNLAGNSAPALPQPMFNILNGGKHADSGLDIQEFMLAPVAFDTFAEKVRVGSEILHTLHDLLTQKGYSTGVGDEGGFAPKLHSNEEALELMVAAIELAGYNTEQVKIGIDAAASSFYNDGKYTLKINGEAKTLSSAELIVWYQSLAAQYPLMLIEDGLAEDDWDGFTSLTQAMGDTDSTGSPQATIIVGDDLLVTTIQRIQTAIEKNAVNAVLIKPNQIGTVTEAIEAVLLTKKQGWKPFASHRSGETTDTFIADFAVGLACPLIKSGSLMRGERVCKYNRLMEIEKQLAV